MQRRDFIKTNLTLLGTGLLTGWPLLKSLASSRSFKKVILLGIDGLDYKILHSLLLQGRLPNFAQLASQGGLCPFHTSTPPQSPVSWSCLATGLGPDKHGLYDFIERDPNNYLPKLSITKQEEGNIFSAPSYTSPLKARPFWDDLVSAGIQTTILRWPITFPAQGEPGLKLLSGMGVPDIQGHLGRYAFYTEETPVADAYKDKVIPLRFQDNLAHTIIKGPLVSGFTGIHPASIDLTLQKTGNLLSVKFQGKDLLLKEGQSSKWVKFIFELGFGKKVAGIGRFCLVSIHPLKLYLSPINLDPAEPAFPISYPKGYSQELTKELGEFATLGIPADTKALTEGRLDDGQFLSFALDLLKEQESLFLHEFNRFQEGLLAGIIFTTDRIQHMFWAAQDPAHPLFTKTYHSKFGQVIRQVYERMDCLLGKILKAINPEQTLLLVFSDHGFNPYYHSVHVNSLLTKLGFLHLKKDQDPNDSEGGPLFAHVDWQKTAAYALGLNSLYINLKGREGQGIIAPQEYKILVQKISRGLLEAKDPNSGQKIFANIFHVHKDYSESNLTYAPDLILGFNPGFRASWQTAIGGTPNDLTQVNRKKWSGDHCIAPDFVPGILLANHSLQKKRPTVYDLAPSVFVALGLPHKTRFKGSSFI